MTREELANKLENLHHNIKTAIDPVQRATYVRYLLELIPEVVKRLKECDGGRRMKIGRCGECKWWERAEKDWGFCHSEATSLWKSGEDFGCIHWEAKQE